MVGGFASGPIPSETHVKLVGRLIPCGSGLTLCETHNTDPLLAYSALSCSSSRFFTWGWPRNFIIWSTFQSVPECHSRQPNSSHFCFTFPYDVFWLLNWFATHSAFDLIKWKDLVRLALIPTDIVVQQTGQEGCLHTVEIQTEIQV